VSRATEIYASEFDSVFFKLPLRVREAIENKIHQLGSRLADYRTGDLRGEPSIGYALAITA
jgi:hypothetical protein